MWAETSVFYQIYPLGFCGAPFENDGVPKNRIAKVDDWIPHIQKLGANAIYFSPVFESDTHGYNTRDFFLLRQTSEISPSPSKVVLGRLPSRGSPLGLAFVTVKMTAKSIL